ncbi:hypothetical protein [Actinomycetospora termitidis]|uniref:Uncharacterized protein n=1 Tax=Actinomycetospora termitidis TaxID=3053470 RepID=A0ABT7MFF9_9PSEU|nr:hypothetical protein [Actinomycetospora sp. Odt1-22]MDL5159405.1 hypothetical protein [Actinomycetospora sp. Odt1-22]
MNTAGSVLVVELFVDQDTDEAAVVRTGLRAFRAVRTVVPVRGAPDDHQALVALARSNLQRRNDELEREVAELRMRLEGVTASTTGELPTVRDMLAAKPVRRAGEPG